MTTAVVPFITETYTVLMHQAEEGGYWGEVLELPGCVSQGETLDEFRQNIREAIEAVLDAQSQVRGEFHENLRSAQEIGTHQSRDILGDTARETWTAAH